MKRFLSIVLAAMLLMTAAALADDVTITYMASQDWVQDAEMELGKKFTELTAVLLGDETPEDMLKAIDRNRADQALAAQDPAWN